MKTLIIGNGEVGSSLYKVLKDKHETFIRDIEPLKVENVDVLNICYPPFKDFVKVTKAYIKEYNPKVTIIHSTVPVGTTRACGDTCVHSPIHGLHPNLDSGILAFVKYLGGTDAPSLELASKFLGDAGIMLKAVSSPEASELSKILCTTYYGWNILYAKEVEKICKEYDVPFHEVYGWNDYYNLGYSQLGKDNVVRPVLRPVKGKIGGHCIIPNCHLLDSFLTKTIIDRNKTYE